MIRGNGSAQGFFHSRAMANRKFKTFAAVVVIGEERFEAVCEVKPGTPGNIEMTISDRAGSQAFVTLLLPADEVIEAVDETRRESRPEDGQT